MSLNVVEIATLASGAVNEDRAGAEGEFAWVFDGATDVVETPLTGYASDAAWMAATLDDVMRELARAPYGGALGDLPARLSERMAEAFDAVKQREPAGRREHPSASGLIVRRQAGRLHFVSVGDCTLLAGLRTGVLRLGTRDGDGGDRWLAAALTAFHRSDRTASPARARAHVWPKIASARELMNRQAGYGVFSITPTPERFITTGTVELAPGGTALLASDGLLRLVDVFGAYTSGALLEAATQRGVAALIAETRALETADASCRSHPRAKPHDDATGLLLAG